MERFTLDKYNALVSEGKKPTLITKDGRKAEVLCTDFRNYCDPEAPIVVKISYVKSDSIEYYKVNGDHNNRHLIGYKLYFTE